MNTRLLVSVRDAGEAADALAAGADLIDLKEPRRGALGAVEPTVMREVATLLAGRVPLSAALGELLAAPAITAPPEGIDFAKIGLAGCASREDWSARLAAAIKALPTTTQAVAVVYADEQPAQAPDAAAVLHQALTLGCRAVLVDTWRKDAGGLLDLWSLPQCADLIAQVRAAGLIAVIAGSLSEESLLRVLPLRPDYVAVRGAACEGNRAGRLSAERVRKLAALVHGTPQHAGPRNAPTTEHPIPLSGSLP